MSADSLSAPRFALTVDCVVFGLDEDDLKVLLVQRAAEPFVRRWALPGGFVSNSETTDDAALRVLEQKTGVRDVYLEQLYTFSAVERDPRQRVVSVAHYALVQLNQLEVRAATEASDTAWFSIDEATGLAFDHDRILQVAYERVRAKVRYEPIGFELLPKKFTLTQLQRLYEIVLDTELDKRNFRKKILSMDLLRPLDEVEKGVARRAARLYSFDQRRYAELKLRGFSFEL